VTCVAMRENPTRRRRICATALSVVSRFPMTSGLATMTPFCPVCVLLLETGSPLWSFSPFDAVLEDVHRHSRAACGEEPAPNAGEEA
jgi:hypothetical protein